MQNKTIKMLRSLLVMLTAGLIVASCNKKFDQPPAFIEPDVTVNTTIKAVKQNHIIGAIEKIEEDLIIGGVVVADDRTGNFYKSIAIQDETGGITVRLDGTNLYTSYPVGRKIYINLKGLYIGDYNRLIQIGGGIDNTDPSRPELSPLAASLFDTYIIKGSTGNTVTPKVVTVAELHDSLQSMLIQLDNMEFVTADTSKTYADAAGKQSVNLSVKGCTGGSVIVRTSGYSNFAGQNVPNGNGTLLAIYTMFGNTKQLVIRGPEDVQFTETRCGAGPLTEMNIADVKALYQGSNVLVPNNRKIRGVVISDRVNNNIDIRNLILQQGNGKAGILIRFSDPHNFDLGDSLEVNVSNQSVEDFRGTLQLNGVPNDFAVKVGTGVISARVATAAEVAANFEAWESTLVQINDVTISGGTDGKWSGGTTFTDATGSVKSFTRNGTSGVATFAFTAYPTEADFVKGYLSQNNSDLQLILRNLNDVEAETVTPPPTGGSNSLIISEYVEGSSFNKYIEIYNAGNAAINLNEYVVKLYSNGQSTVTNSVRLDTIPGNTSATLAAGGIIVIRHTQASLALPAGVTAFAHDVVNFNGDDVIELEKNGVVVDVFGQKGSDPGSSWTIAGNTSGALDKTVRRKAGINAGNTDWTASAANEWDVAGKDDVSNLGTR